MKICMLVFNNCVLDQRVRREARALAEVGHEVLILALHAKAVPLEEWIEGVHIMRYPWVPDWFLKCLQKLGVMSFTYVPISLANLLPTGNLEPLSLGFRTVLKKIMGYLYRLCFFREAFARRLYRSTFLPHALKTNADCYHAHELYTLEVAGLAATQLGKRLVYDSHEYERDRVATHRSRWDWYFWRRLESYWIKKVDRVITVSQSIAHALQRDHGIEAPSVIVNTPEIAWQEVQNRVVFDIRGHYGLNEESRIIMFVGGIQVRRGIEELLDAMKLLPHHVHLFLIGPNLMPDLLEAAQATLHPRLHVVEPVAHQELMAYLAGASLSLCLIQQEPLSYRYSLPNKFFESVFAGTPILASRCPEFKRFIDRFENGLLCDETSPQAIAEGIMTLLQDRARYVPDPATLQVIWSEYGWAHVKQKLQDLYTSLPTTDTIYPKTPQ